MFKWLGLGLIAFFAAVVCAGCSSKLDTGYEPRKLGATEVERRAMYAPAFSPEAKAGKTRKDDLDQRRPSNP